MRPELWKGEQHEFASDTDCEMMRVAYQSLERMDDFERNFVERYYERFSAGEMMFSSKPRPDKRGITGMTQRQFLQSIFTKYRLSIS